MKKQSLIAVSTTAVAFAAIAAIAFNFGFGFGFGFSKGGAVISPANIPSSRFESAESRDAAYAELAARQAKTLAAIAAMYKSDVGSSPTSLDSFLAEPDGVDGWRGPYLSDPIPLDPWGRDYRINGDRISSAGKDGAFGTKDDVSASIRKLQD